MKLIEDVVEYEKSLEMGGKTNSWKRQKGFTDLRGQPQIKACDVNYG